MITAATAQGGVPALLAEMSLTTRYGVDPGVFAAEWWENAADRRLPGEEGGYSVFGIQFWDGCWYFDYTAGGVMERVVDVGCGPVDNWRNDFVSAHVGQMAYVVRCVASELAVEDATALVSLLVSEAPGEVKRGFGTVEVRGCPLGEDPAPVVSMSFGDWVKSREEDVSGEIPE